MCHKFAAHTMCNWCGHILGYTELLFPCRSVQGQVNGTRAQCETTPIEAINVTTKCTGCISLERRKMAIGLELRMPSYNSDSMLPYSPQAPSVSEIAPPRTAPPTTASVLGKRRRETSDGHESPKNKRRALSRAQTPPTTTSPATRPNPPRARGGRQNIVRRPSQSGSNHHSLDQRMYPMRRDQPAVSQPPQVHRKQSGSYALPSQYLEDTHPLSSQQQEYTVYGPIHTQASMQPSFTTHGINNMQPIQSLVPRTQEYIQPPPSMYQEYLVSGTASAHHGMAYQIGPMDPRMVMVDPRLGMMDPQMGGIVSQTGGMNSQMGSLPIPTPTPMPPRREQAAPRKVAESTPSHGRTNPPQAQTLPPSTDLTSSQTRPTRSATVARPSATAHPTGAVRPPPTRKMPSQTVSISDQEAQIPSQDRQPPSQKEKLAELPDARVSNLAEMSSQIKPVGQQSAVSSSSRAPGSPSVSKPPPAHVLIPSPSQGPLVPTAAQIAPSTEIPLTAQVSAATEAPIGSQQELAPPHYPAISDEDWMHATPELDQYMAQIYPPLDGIVGGEFQEFDFDSFLEQINGEVQAGGSGYVAQEGGES